MAERPFSVLSGDQIRQGMGRRGLVVVRKIKPSVDQQSLDETINPLKQGFDYGPTALFGTPDGSVYHAQMFYRKKLTRPEDVHNPTANPLPPPGTDIWFKIPVSQAGALVAYRIFSIHAGLTAISTLLQIYERDPSDPQFNPTYLDSIEIYRESVLIPVVNTGGLELEMGSKTGLERKFLQQFQGQSLHQKVIPGGQIPKYSPQNSPGAVQSYLYGRLSAWTNDPNWAPRLELFIEDRGF